MGFEITELLWSNTRFYCNLQGKLFQRCTHLLYCSVLSLGGNVNTRRMSKPDMGSIFHIQNQWNILVIGNRYVNYQNDQNLMLLTSSDTKRTLMHLFLITNSAQRELVSMCTQSIRNCNRRSLHYNHDLIDLLLNYLCKGNYCNHVFQLNALYTTLFYRFSSSSARHLIN